MAKRNALSKKQSQLKEVQQHLSDGLESFAIQEVMGLTDSELRALVSEVLDGLAKHISEMPIEHVYAQFVLDGHSLIRKLNRSASRAKTQRDAVSAYKTMWDIKKDLLETGKRFGILKPDINEIQEGAIGINLTVVNDLGIEELVQETQGMITKVQQLHKVAGGNKDFLEVQDGKPMFNGASVFELQEQTKEEDKKEDKEQ